MNHRRNDEDGARNGAIIDACKQIDPVNGESVANTFIDAMEHAVDEWMDPPQCDAAKQWLLLMTQKLIVNPESRAPLTDKMAYASAALKAIAAYSLQRASPEDRQQAERSAEVMSMRTGLGTAIGILLAAVTVIERTTAQLLADALPKTNGGAA